MHNTTSLFNFFVQLYILGFRTGQIQFPRWLGKNSKKSKVDRILQELQIHTRLSVGVSKGSLALDYGQVLRDHIIAPLVKQGADGVNQAVSSMGEYSLLKEDLTGLIEVTQWPDKPDPLRVVASKTKAAFTRKYNKEGRALPYSVTATVSKNNGVGGSDNLMPVEEEDGIDDVEDEDMVTIEKLMVARKVEAK